MGRILIATPSYSSAVGGIIVLHKLCDILNNLGYDAYITTTEKLCFGNYEYIILNDGYNTKIATDLDIENDIVIYPEIQPGNPLGCKNVVRYILNKYHLPEHENNMVTWDENDYWLYFHELFYDQIKPKNMLHIIDPKLDIFKDYGLERKNEACFTYRKKSKEIKNLNIIHPKDAIEIPYSVVDEDLIHIFNTSKRFYSYDTETYLSILASICGCESIVVPYMGFTKSQILDKQPSFKYGIAYGLDDLEYANSTKHLLIEHLALLEQTQNQNTDIEFQKIIQHFNLK